MVNELTNVELERLTTDFFNISSVEHLHRYAIASQLCAGRDVLDIASGEGYGANLLARTARRVVGVDIAWSAVKHATSKYGSDNLAFVQGTVDAVPLRAESVEVVVSFETLEHHDRHREMLREIKRVLRPSGLLIISTPEKLFYSDVANYRNIHHVKELYGSEFESLLAEFFAHHAMFFQSICYGTLVGPLSWGEFCYFRGDFSNIVTCEALPRPEFNVAIASDSPIPSIPTSFFDGIAALKDNRRQSWETVPQLHHQLRRQQELLDGLRNSWSFRLGRALTWPARMVRNAKRKLGTTIYDKN